MFLSDQNSEAQIHAALDIELDKSKETVVIQILYLKDKEAKIQRRRNDRMETILWIFLEQKGHTIYAHYYLSKRVYWSF